MTEGLLQLCIKFTDETFFRQVVNKFSVINSHQFLMYLWEIDHVIKKANNSQLYNSDDMAFLQII